MLNNPNQPIFLQLDSFKSFAQVLAELLPERFFFKQNDTWWFLRDLEMCVMDLRSNAEYSQSHSSLWGFLGPMCMAYGVKNIEQRHYDSLPEAMFAALIEAVEASKATTV